MLQRDRSSGARDVGLQIEGLHRRYGDVVALDDVSFDVPPGRMVGFVGRNGAGKTTTMRAVMGVMRPDRGEVRWRGSPIDASARLRFGYMPEERGLYPKMRVRDQLMYFARLSGLDRPAAQDGADRWIERLGLTERVDSPIDDLSLGNQQRVQLGVALIHQPDLLILDEPFSGLDPVGVDVLAGALREEVARGAGVVFSSHQLDLIERLCDDVVIIESGRIVREADAAMREAGAGSRWSWRCSTPGPAGPTTCRASGSPSVDTTGSSSTLTRGSTSTRCSWRPGRPGPSGCSKWGTARSPSASERRWTIDLDSAGRPGGAARVRRVLAPVRLPHRHAHHRADRLRGRRRDQHRARAVRRR